MKKIAFFIALLTAAIPFVGYSQQRIIPPTNSVKNSFAIFVDSKSYEACRVEIESYKASVEEDGLPTFLLIAEWESPEHVKYFLERYHREQYLEGAVFIGDIPIAMIREAQHFTSAFKMDEKRHPFIVSSVPSDRFYDDFDLKFDFIKQDSAKSNFYYYRLRGDSHQMIDSEIYTARIKPTAKGEKGYKQIRDYLTKVVKEKSETNPLDKLSIFLGHGSHSNSLIAWRDAVISVEQQLPLPFSTLGGGKSYRYDSYPSMKEYVTKELQRADLDLMIFNEHGTPDRQYLTGTLPPGRNSSASYLENFKRELRGRIRRGEESDSTKKKEELVKRYNIPMSWVEGAFSKELIAKDSLYDVNTGIVLDDVLAIKPNPRVVIFDACYNGDFREDRYIAGEYIFAEGRNIVSIGNSVNAIQDKTSNDLLGILGYGARVGEWAKEINNLESHIIGDPTFKFAKPKGFPNIKYHSKDTTYWLAVLEHKLPSSFNELALLKLHECNYNKMPELLDSIFHNSPSYMVRKQAMELAAYYGGEVYSKILKSTTNDNFEFIRRKGLFYMGKVGLNEFIPNIAKSIIDDNLSERVRFNAGNIAGHVNDRILMLEVEKQAKERGYDLENSPLFDYLLKQIEFSASLRDEYWGIIIDKRRSAKRRLSAISILRNNPYSMVIDDMLRVVADSDENRDVRKALAEALGWFVRSHNSKSITDTLKTILLEEQSIDSTLKDEILKSYNRLLIYQKSI